MRPVLLAYLRRRFPVNFRQRRNPVIANERKKTREAIPTASPQLEPCKDNGNKSGQKMATTRPPKPPQMTPTQMESKFRDSLPMRDCSFAPAVVHPSSAMRGAADRLDSKFRFSLFRSARISEAL